MRKHIFLFFLALLFFVACKWDNAPSGIIKQEPMTNLLIAVHLVDGSLSSLDPAPDTLYKYGTGKYLALFKQFHTDTAQFRKSVRYYTVHPDKMEAMYTEIVKVLNAKQDSLNKVLLKQNTKHALPAK